MAWEEEITDPKQKGLFEPFMVLPQTDTSLSVVNIVNNDLVADITLKEPIVLSDGRPDAEIRPTDVERMVVEDITIYDEQVIPFLASWLKRASAQSSLLPNLPAGFWYQYLEDIVRKKRKLSAWLDDDDPNQMDFGYRVIFSPRVPADRADDRLDIINFFGRTVGSIHGFIWLNDNKYPEEVVTPEDISYMVVTKVEFDLDDPGVVDFWLDWCSQTPKANLSEVEHKIEAFKKRAAWTDWIEEEPQDKLFFDWAVYYIDDSKLEVRDWDNNLLAELFLHMEPLWPLFKEKSKGTIISPEDIVRLVIGNFKIYEPDIIPYLNKWFGRAWINGGRVYYWDGQWNPLPNDTWYNEYRSVISAWFDDEENKDQLGISSAYSIFYKGRSTLEIVSPSGNVVGLVEGDMSFSPWPEVGEEVYPEYLEFIEVSEIVGVEDPNSKEFLRSWFEKARLSGALCEWDKNRWIDEYEYGTASWRDREYITNIEKLVRVYDELYSYSYDGFDYWWTEEDFEYELSDEPDEYGLYWYDVILLQPMPPEIVFEPDTWSELCQKAFGDYQLINPLIEVPKFILEEGAQQVNPDESLTESYDAWQSVGGLSYIDDEIKKFMTTYASYPEITAWLQELDNKLTSSNAIPGQDQLPDTFSSYKLSDSTWFDDEESEDQTSLEGEYYMQYYHGTLVVKDEMWDEIHTTILISEISPHFIDRVEPEEVELVEVEELPLTTPTIEDFIVNWFTQVNNHGGIAAWSKKKALENGDYHYKTADWRDRVYINNLNDLLDVYDSLDFFTVDMYEYEWGPDDITFELDDDDVVDDYGLYEYNVIVWYPLPPEIVLTPQKWEELIQEWVQGGKSPIYLEALYEVPRFIIDEPEQNYNSRVKMTETYQAWVQAGGMDYVNSRLEQIKKQPQMIWTSPAIRVGSELRVNLETGGWVRVPNVMYHVADRAHRESIHSNGLLPATEPNSWWSDDRLPGVVYLSTSLEDSKNEWIGNWELTDIWAVEVEGLSLAPDPEYLYIGRWWITPEHIAPERLSLFAQWNIDEGWEELNQGLPDTFSSHKLSDSTWFDDGENKDQISLEGEYYMQYHQGNLAIKDEISDKIHTTVLISEISPHFTEGDRVKPEDVELVEVEELRFTKPTIEDFIVNWFTQVNDSGGVATWSKTRALESDNYSFQTADWRDSEYIENLGDLLEVYADLHSFTIGYYEYEWGPDDITFELDDNVDDYGLYEYNVIVWYPLPPEIVLTPQKWEDLVQEWVQGGKDPTHLHALYAVPRFIMDEPEQKYNWGGKMTETYQAWVQVGGIDYLNSRFQQIKPGTLSSHKLSDSNWITEENEDQTRLEDEYYMQYGKANGREFLAVKDKMWDKKYATILIDRIYPNFTNGDRVEPEDVELVEVEGLYWESDRGEYRDFIVDWFTQVNSHGGVAAWYRTKGLENNNYVAAIADWREHKYINNLNDLLEVYYSLRFFTVDMYEYEWGLGDITFELDDDDVVDDYGLYEYNAIVWYPLPPEIKLTPQRWEDLVLSVSGYNYRNLVSPSFWDALYEVPKFILEDPAQQYNADGTIPETYQAWVQAGGMDYVNSRLEQAKRRFPDQD